MDIVVVDFGSQTAHLIARRLRDLGADTQIIHPEEALEKIQDLNPRGVVLSGGPSSVYERGAPTIDKKVFSLGIPLLGICYGYQITSHLLGGKVVTGKKEYGPANLRIKINGEKMVKGVPKSSTVWMSHGDEIVRLPRGFEVIASTEHFPFAISVNKENKFYCLQFHPEVEHTQFGNQILSNFIEITGTRRHKRVINPDEIIGKIKETVGDSHVVAATSGGVDSTVAGALVAKAIGKNFTPIFVDNGLMREGSPQLLKKVFGDYEVKPIIVDVKAEMLKRLKGITDPEKKRITIGNFYIEVFERTMKKLPQNKKVAYLMQGTIYSDVIESQGSKHASKIKSHHNVGGLPKNMKLKLLEPLREYYKDEVRMIGRKIGLSDEIVMRQPFPGPGYAVRIRGEVTKERLEKEKRADRIVLEEMEKAELLDKVFLSFPVMTNASSTAVKGDGRFFGEVVALRIIESSDIMTTTWSRLPYDLLQKISSRIVNEVPGISRVVYDITTKPPATMEWE